MKACRLSALATLSLAVFLSVCTTSTAAAADVPAALKAPADQKLSLEAHANGVQIYECKASKADPKVFEWAFKAPEAELSDAAGARIGKHYAGPTWESSDPSRRKTTAPIPARFRGSSSARPPARTRAFSAGR